MQKIYNFIDSLTLSDSGSWASIIGFILTLLTLLMLWGIKKKFLFRSSIDDHINKLVEISSDVSSSLQSYEKNMQEIDELFALANVELRAMQRGAEGDLLADIKKARGLIKKYNSKLYFWIKKDERAARDIKTSFSVVSAELYHQKKALTIGS